MKLFNRYVLVLCLLVGCSNQALFPSQCNKVQHNKVENQEVYEVGPEVSITDIVLQIICVNHRHGRLQSPIEYGYITLGFAYAAFGHTIRFENDAELAAEAASKVTITVPLHEKPNYATFGVGSCSTSVCMDVNSQQI